MKRTRTILLTAAVFLMPLAFPAAATAAWKAVRTENPGYTAAKKKYVKEAWKKIDGKWYYFDSRGKLKTGRFQVGDNYYYVKEKTGRVKNRKVGSYYYGSDGAMVKNTWKTIEKKRFYFGEDGKIKLGKFELDGQIYCCTTKSGKVTNKWYKGNFFDGDGVMAVSQWIGKGDNRCYVDEEGTITKGNKDPMNPPSEDSIRLLAALTYLEAGNQKYKGKVAVASVVLNRKNSKDFPNTLRGVIYQEGQFDPAVSGALDELYYSKKKIQKECMKAAEEVLTEGSKLKGYYYFNIYQGNLKIGDHYFS